MKNWAVAESGSLVRAIAIVPRALLRPFLDSFLTGSRVSFSFWSFAPNPPPWIMKPGITRWIIVSS